MLPTSLTLYHPNSPNEWQHDPPLRRKDAWPKTTECGERDPTLCDHGGFDICTRGVTLTDIGLPPGPPESTRDAKCCDKNLDDYATCLESGKPDCCELDVSFNARNADNIRYSDCIQQEWCKEEVREFSECLRGLFTSDSDHGTSTGYVKVNGQYIVGPGKLMRESLRFVPNTAIHTLGEKGLDIFGNRECTSREN